jgi:hypothetical protein
MQALARPSGAARTRYLQVLTWAFTLFSTVRVAAYVPTMWSIWQSERSDQHSLLTWLTWVGANATMAAWLYEHNGARADRVVLVNLCNAVMCLATAVLIVWFRL